MDRPSTPTPKSTPPSRRAAAGPPAAYHHGDLRNALLREGRALLEALGPAEMSLREVARRVGVSEAAPSRHFEGKEGLLANIAAEGFRELAAQRRAIVAEGLDPLDTARRMLLSYVRYAQRNKGVFNLMVGPRILDQTRHPDLAVGVTESYGLFSDAVIALALACGWKKRQVHLVAHAAWAMEHGLATLILADRAPSRSTPVELDAMVEFSIDMALSAIAAGPDGMAAVKAKPKPKGRRKVSPA